MLFSRTAENLVAALRGLPENHSRAKIRKEQPIGSVLEGLVERYKVNQPSIEEILMDNWKVIIGPHYAHRCAPQKILHNGATLVIATANPTLRSELSMRKGEILKQIQSIPGCQSIRELFLKQG